MKVSDSATIKQTVTNSLTLVVNPAVVVPPPPPPPTTDVTTGIIPQANDTFLNWSHAGLRLTTVGGITAVDAARTACAQVVSPSGGDDATAIKNAIAACAANTILTLGTSFCTCANPCVFSVNQSDLPIVINKSITVRGFGAACPTLNSAGTWWPAEVKVKDGAIPDWTVSASTTNVQCGISASQQDPCTAASAVFLLSPSGNWDWGWSNCLLGSTPTNCGTKLAADVAQGTTTVQVASTANFTVGGVFLIDENPVVGSLPNPIKGQAAVIGSADLFSTSSLPATMRLMGGDIPAAYSFNPNRVNAEIKLITAIGAGPCPGVNCTLTFDTPLSLAFRQSGGHDGRVYWPTHQQNTSNPFLQKAGLENMAISKGSNGGVLYTFCQTCFGYGLDIFDWSGGAVNINYSLRTEVDFAYMHSGTDPENNGNEYPLGINQASTETLIQDSIFRLGGKGMVGRASNTSVLAYNYVDDAMYMQAVIGNSWVDMALNQSHYAGTHHALMEGNWANNGDGDETHGNAIYMTFLRNQLTGVRTKFIDPSTGMTVDDINGIALGGSPGPLRAAGPMAFNYWYVFTGNYLGIPNVTTKANGWSYQGLTQLDGKVMFMSGWTGGEWNSENDPNLGSGAFLFKNCNFDTVNNTAIDCAPAGFSRAIPNSFYLGGKPTFFAGATCSYAWPWVDPVTGVASNSCGGSGLPAKARYEAGTPFKTP